jgi:hypothetical protein
MGAYHLQDEGQIIPSEQIEIYKNMYEDGPELISLRKQAAKDPEGMLATALLQVGTLYSSVNNLPALISQLAGSSGKIMDFMTANEIDNSEMKDKLTDII